MRLSATEASREFSDLLSRVAAGESVEVERHGHLVAVVVPAPRGDLSGSDLLGLLDRLPMPDPDFGRDVARLADVLKAPANPWLS